MSGELFEEGEQLVGWPVAAGADSWWRGPVEGALFDGLVGVDVDLGWFRAFVAFSGVRDSVNGFDLGFCCLAQLCAICCQLSRLRRAMSSRLI